MQPRNLPRSSSRSTSSGSRTRSSSSSSSSSRRWRRRCGGGNYLQTDLNELMCSICYGHWDLHLVVSRTGQAVRFITGIGFCVL